MPRSLIIVSIPFPVQCDCFYDGAALLLRAKDSSQDLGHHKTQAKDCFLRGSVLADEFRVVTFFEKI